MWFSAGSWGLEETLSAEPQTWRFGLNVNKAWSLFQLSHTDCWNCLGTHLMAVWLYFMLHNVKTSCCSLHWLEIQLYYVCICSRQWWMKHSDTKCSSNLNQTSRQQGVVTSTAVILLLWQFKDGDKQLMVLLLQLLIEYLMIRVLQLVMNAPFRLSPLSCLSPSYQVLSWYLSVDLCAAPRSSVK